MAPRGPPKKGGRVVRLTVFARKRYEPRMRVLLAILLAATTASRASAEPVRTQDAGLRFTHPGEWVRVPAPSDMRAAQFRVPKVGGDTEDAEAVLFFFGPGKGGGTQDNLERWYGQMTQPDGKASKDAGVVIIKTVKNLKVTALDLPGTYKGMPAPGAPATAKSGYRLLAAAIEGEGGPWFFRIVGPDATVKAAKPAFDALLESVEAHP
jgi:hypothetical protein